MRLITPVTPLVLAGALLVSGPAHAQQHQDSVPRSASFWRAAGGLAAINGLTWSYNWYVKRWHWANVGTRAWWNNLRHGFAWDDDAYMVNQLAHPYHGSLYFNSARGSGYGFWGSTAFAMAGSITWELLNENVRPSLNDLINTTLGGIALGEATFRISSLLRSEGGKGAGLARKAGAFILNPIGGFQSLLNGGDRFPIRAYSGPSSSSAWISIGHRAGIHPSAGIPVPRQTFIGLSVLYGSPFAAGSLRPYDAFEFSLQLDPNNRGLVTHAAVSGLLTRHALRQSQETHLVLGIYQHFDYDEMPGFKTSSQSLSGGLLLHHEIGTRTDLFFALHAEAIPLGAVSSDYAGVRNRDFDYGIGGGGRFTASLRRSGRNLVRLDGRSMWIHSLYGADADHITTSARLTAVVPLLRGFGLGGDAGLTFRRSWYRDQPRVLTRAPQLRAYLVWSP
jgi:Domain of unknown function (DUF3943)